MTGLDFLFWALGIFLLGLLVLGVAALVAIFYSLWQLKNS